jgi:hypothetical protein
MKGIDCQGRVEVARLEKPEWYLESNCFGLWSWMLLLAWEVRGPNQELISELEPLVEILRHSASLIVFPAGNWILTILESWRRFERIVGTGLLLVVEV